MVSSWPSKDPQDVLDYYIDWLGTADAPGPLFNIVDTLTASSWTVPTGITKDSDTFTAEGITQIWLSGGTIGTVYEFVNHITTAGGRQFDKTVKIRVKAH